MTFPPLGIGSIIAVIVLVLAILFGVFGRLPWEIAGLLALLACARLT
jgi:hypothetical protein